MLLYNQPRALSAALFFINFLNHSLWTPQLLECERWKLVKDNNKMLVYCFMFTAHMV